MKSPIEPAPRISIIVPTLNEAEGIAAALAALAPLREQGHEVIVVDGGSGDGTPALARGAADRVISAPRGRASQMNAAAALARGAVLLFLHADTRLPENADTRILHGLAASGRAWGRFDAEAFERAGRFPPLELMEDIALSSSLKRVSRPLCIAEKVVTSGRRWERRGILRTVLLMWRLRLEFFFGAAPASLARLYDGDRG